MIIILYKKLTIKIGIDQTLVGHQRQGLDVEKVLIKLVRASPAR